MSHEKPHGLSLCMLAHQMNVAPYGNDGLVKFLEHCSPNVEEINLVDTSQDGDLDEKLKGKAPDNVKIYRTTTFGKENWDDVYCAITSRNI